MCFVHVFGNFVHARSLPLQLARKLHSLRNFTVVFRMKLRITPLPGYCT